MSGQAYRSHGVAEFDQVVDVPDVFEEDLSRAALLEVAVVETDNDNMVDCVFGVGDRGLTCMVGHLKVTVCCNSLDPGSEGFCGLLGGLLGLVEVNPVDCWMED